MSEEGDPAETLGVAVPPERRAVARLLVRACVNTGSLSSGKLPLRALGDAVGHSPQLFADWLAGPVIPRLATLLDLQEKAGITLEDSLAAFDLLPTSSASGQRDELTPARRDLLQAMEGWTEDEVRAVAVALRQAAAAARRGKRRGARPTTANTSPPVRAPKDPPAP